MPPPCAPQQGVLGGRDASGGQCPEARRRGAHRHAGRGVHDAPAGGGQLHAGPCSCCRLCGASQRQLVRCCCPSAVQLCSMQASALSATSSRSRSRSYHANALLPCLALPPCRLQVKAKLSAAGVPGDMQLYVQDLLIQVWAQLLQLQQLLLLLLRCSPVCWCGCRRLKPALLAEACTARHALGCPCFGLRNSTAACSTSCLPPVTGAPAVPRGAGGRGEQAQGAAGHRLRAGGGPMLLLLLLPHVCLLQMDAARGASRPHPKWSRLSVCGC